MCFLLEFLILLQNWAFVRPFEILKLRLHYFGRYYILHLTEATQHADQEARAPRRIYVAFAEHPATGVCVCVCSWKLDSGGLVVWVFVCVNVFVGFNFVCLFRCSLIRVSLCFLDWFVGCLGVWSMCAFVRFRHLRYNFLL